MHPCSAAASSWRAAVDVRIPQSLLNCNHLPTQLQGTSMPIRIPPMHRRGLATSPGAQEGRSTAFVPPHLLDLHADATADGGTLASFKDSPSQASANLLNEHGRARSLPFPAIDRLHLSQALAAQTLGSCCTK